MSALNHSFISDCAALWTAAHQAPLSMGFSRREYWSGLSFPSPEDLPDPEMEPTSPESPASAGRFFTTESPGKPSFTPIALCTFLWSNTHPTLNAPPTAQSTFPQKIQKPAGHSRPSIKVVVIYTLLSLSLGDFPSGSVVKNLPADAGDAGSIPESGRSPGEGNSNLLQFSCLENSMDRGDWWATVHGVTKVGCN